MSSEQKDVAAPPVDSDGEDDDLFADSDDEKAQTEEGPIKSPTQITKSIVAAIKTEPVSTPETSEPEPQVVPVAVKQENNAPKPASNDTYASIPRKSAAPSSPTTAPAPSSPPKVSSPIPKKTVNIPSDASPGATAPAKYGLPKETIIPSSIGEDILRYSGGKTLDNLRSLKDIKLINDALKEYDDAVKLNGNSIRHHGAYLLGVVKRYVSVQERAARSGGASIPMGNELTPPVHQRLQKLVKDGFCTSAETRDDKIQGKLKMLSEKDALAAIEEMASVDRSSVRNFGSYFMGILNRYMRGEKQQVSENKGANYQRNQSRRGRTSTKQDPNEMYRRERSRDRSNSGDNHGGYGPRGSQRGNNNPHLANYDNRRNGGGSSYYGNNNNNNNGNNGNQHQYPPTSRYQNNNNGPTPPAMGGGRLPPPPPPPPPRQSSSLPPPPPTQYQAPPQAPQMQQPQPPPQSHYGQQQPPPSQYGAQQPPPNPGYGQQQQPYGATQQQPPNNSYYGSQQNQQQQQQPYGTAAPSPYGGAPQQQPQQQQQPYMQQPPSAPQATNGYQQQPQQQWQQPPAAQGGSSMPAGIVDILGIADKAASAVQALQSQNRPPNIPQQQPQAPVQPPQQQYQQPPPQQAPPMQQQQYQPQQSYQQQQPPPQQQYQQQQPPQSQGNNQYNQYGAPPPSQYGAPSPYAPQQAPPMGQPPHQQQHNRYQNQQQQNYNQPPYQGGQYPPPPQGYSQHQQQPHGNQNRGNRQGRGKSRRTTAQLHELPMSVQNMVHQIQNTRQVDGPLDEGILGMVKDLPEHMALQSLQKFISIDKKSMRSKTAYLAGVLRRELERIHRR